MDETKNDNDLETIGNDNSINQISPNTAAPAQVVTNQSPTFQPPQPTQIKEDPGKTLGIIGLIIGIIGFVFPIVPIGVVGLVLSIIGYKKSKNVNLKNVFALTGIILNTITIVLFIGLVILASLIMSNPNT